MNYMNRFSVIAYREESISITSKGNLKLFIEDQVFYEKHSSQLIQFSGDQLPLIWRSFGQFLKIVVGLENTKQIQQHITIITLAIFDSDDVLSYISNDRQQRIQYLCPEFFKYQTKTGCMSINNSFVGSWNSASNQCQEQDGYLWSINDLIEWTEVLSSPQLINKLKVYQPVNAIKYFRKSSIIFLGLKSNGTVRYY